MEKLIIGAPFGNYLRMNGTTPTLGTYTLERRAGIAKRLWKIATTLRPHPSMRAWTNKLGLPNPGIGALREKTEEKIVSISARNDTDWHSLFHMVPPSPLALELNVSCPNCPGEVDSSKYDWVIQYAAYWSTWNPSRIIVKIPPVGYEELVSLAVKHNVWGLHCCNTFPTLAGGMSGKPLQTLSLNAIRWIRKQGYGIKIIGGGGITTLDDISRYTDAGADYFSIASGLLNPFNWRTYRQIARNFQGSSSDN